MRTIPKRPRPALLLGVALPGPAVPKRLLPNLPAGVYTLPTWDTLSARKRARPRTAGGNNASPPSRAPVPPTAGRAPGVLRPRLRQNPTGGHLPHTHATRANYKTFPRIWPISAAVNERKVCVVTCSRELNESMAAVAVSSSGASKRMTPSYGPMHQYCSLTSMPCFLECVFKSAARLHVSLISLGDRKRWQERMALPCSKM
jgi:hypothetical protein